MERLGRKHHELVIPIPIGHLCGAAGMEQGRRMAVAISKRGDVEPFHAMDILAEANRLKALGQPIVSMAVGQPSDPAPQRVRDAAAKALADGRIGYTDALGLSALRK